MDWDWITFIIGLVVGSVLTISVAILFGSVGSDWLDLD